mgnify:CR=1 FL=1
MRPRLLDLYCGAGLLADDLPELGEDIGDFFDSIASAGPGAEKILHVVVETLDAETNETAGMTIRFDLTFLN